MDIARRGVREASRRALGIVSASGGASFGGGTLQDPPGNHQTLSFASAVGTTMNSASAGFMRF